MLFPQTDMLEIDEVSTLKYHIALLSLHIEIQNYSFLHINKLLRTNIIRNIIKKFCYRLFLRHSHMAE